MLNTPSYIPYITVHPHYIATTVKYEHKGTRLPASDNSLANLHRNYHHNVLSQLSKGKLKKAVNYLLTTSSDKFNYTKLNYKELKFKIAFITLTLSAVQIHSDNYIKRNMLNQFLVELKQKWNVTEYVWKAERQLNGNIHFHILVNRFIPWYELRGTWNRIQQKEGYLSRYRVEQEKWHSKGFRLRESLEKNWSRENQIKAYKIGLKTNWSNPNSTDIHSVQFINNVGSYVCKYMSKNDIKRYVQVHRDKFSVKRKKTDSNHSVSDGARGYLRILAEKGRIWSCSYNLTNLTGGQDVIDSTISDELRVLRENGKIKIIDDKYYNIICCSTNDLIKLHCVRLLQLLSEFIVNRFILESG
jgi:hypothetical protein